MNIASKCHDSAFNNTSTIAQQSTLGHRFEIFQLSFCCQIRNSLSLATIKNHKKITELGTFRYICSINTKRESNIETDTTRILGKTRK